MKKILILILLFFCGLSELVSQVVRVYDRSDLQPVGGVTIHNRGKTRLAETDRTGAADLSIFAPEDTLWFNHLAYQPAVMAKKSLPASGAIYLTENVIKLDEFVITGNRTEEKKSDLPYRMEVIQAKEIQFGNPQNAGIMLEQTGEVFVQTSQMGGGSPVLRGFEANKVLLVVDGIRLNNAIYRSGHLQNAITVDPFGLGSTEVLYGPGSTLYGSDALGGVVHFITRDPVLAQGRTLEVHGSALARFTSANLEKTGGVNLNLATRRVGLLLNFSYSDFGDLREGRVRNPAFGTFGERLFFQERVNGKDVTTPNNKPWIQVGSAYSQYNFLGKLMYRPGSKSRYLLNIQFSNSGDVPRYDRLTEMKNDSTLSYAEWYYGPQTRFLGSLRAEYDIKGWLFDRATVVAGYQMVKEDRIQRDFGSSKRKFNLETVRVYSLNADLDKRLSARDVLRYGIEVNFNSVNSEAYNVNIVSMNRTYDRATRYPDGEATTMQAAAYLSNKWNVTEYLTFSQGARFTWNRLNAMYSDTMVKIMNLPFDPKISQSNTALNGYLGLVATPGYDWRISLIGSTGFRAPNIDDLTKLNELLQTTVVVPNAGLKPEYAYNAELSVAKTIAGSVRIEATGFCNWLTDAHVLRPFVYNGKDSLEIDGKMYKTLAPQNAGRAYVCGLQGSLLAQVTKVFSVRSNLTYTYGYDQTNKEPLDHIPPVYGMTSFRLEMKRFKGDLYVMYNAWKRISQYSSSGEDNQKYATPYGMPSWYTLNLKLSYQAAKFLNVEAGMENILDEHYRKFASGISAPGRNVIVSLRASF